MVRVDSQHLTLYDGTRIDGDWPVSTSRHGLGTQANSFRTPPGWHRVAEWIGDGLPLGAVLKGRVPTGRVLAASEWQSAEERDTITTRILWLEGLEPGHNRGPGVDSHDRFIYIHGTNHEQDIGRPASGGCVRMRNRDVLDLFQRTQDKPTWVWIG